MAKKLSALLIVLLLLAGAGLLLYPAVSNYVIERSQGEVIRSYQENIEQLDGNEKEAIRKAALDYNEQLVDSVILTDPFDSEALEEQNSDYFELLNPNGDGVMGYIEIPKIDVYLPVRHGTEAKTLEMGVGHLKNTSLPVGGSASHAVLSAHAGLPSAELFTNLTDMEKADVFYLHILGDVLAYEVDQIKVVLPHETEDMWINQGEDYVTLVTCTPYGINSHRLLVRGTRIPYIAEAKEGAAASEKQSVLMWAYLILIPLTVVLIIIFLVWKKYRKRLKR